MYTIGEISKIVKVSADTLRYYDEIGLVKPIRIDSNTRYRYYSDYQINDILLIMELKQYGFSLDEIRTLLSCKNVQNMKSAFEAKHRELGIELSNIKNIMEVLENRIAELDKEGGAMSIHKTILIVDDCKLVRILIKNIIEKFGYKVIGEACNGLEACEKYLELEPDLVIMDIVMPLVDGIQATKKILEKDNDAKIIICSAMSQAVISLECLRSGAQDFVCKPFSEQRLVTAAINAFDKKHSYNNVSLNELSDIIKIFDSKNLRTHKPLSQEEMDRMLSQLINNDTKNINVNELIGENIIPDHLQSPDFFISLRESNVGGIVLKEITEFFQEIASNSTDYFEERIGRSYSLKIHCVEQSLNYETQYTTNTSLVGTIQLIEKKLPVSIIPLSNMPEDVANELFKYVYNELKPILPGDTCFSVIDTGRYLERYDTVFAQVYLVLELFCPQGESCLLTISMPHESAKTDEFLNKLLHWKLNKL